MLGDMREHDRTQAPGHGRVLTEERRRQIQEVDNQVGLVVLIRECFSVAALAHHHILDDGIRRHHLRLWRQERVCVRDAKHS